MFAEDRQRKLIELLGRKGRLTIQEIEKALNASPATVRRDLVKLAREGHVVRTHGGVMHPAVLHGEPVFQQRVTTAVKAKEKIAGKAVSLIGKNQTVWLDAGSTVLAAAKMLAARSDLVLFTNSIPVSALAMPDGATIHLIGGELRVASQSLVGGFGLEWLKHLHFDAALIGASGLDGGEGASATSLEEAAMKQAAMARAERSILLCDIKKWNSRETVHFAKWSDFDCWIADRKPGGLSASVRKKIVSIS